MKFILIFQDKIAITAALISIIGVLSSFMDFGIISVIFSVTMPVIFIINCLISIYGVLIKKYFYIFGILPFLLCFNLFFQISSNKIEQSNDSISLLSFNVRGFKQPSPHNSNRTSLIEIVKFIDSINPDILLLQESSYKEARNLKTYPYQFLGYREGIGKSLLTIYSKNPIIKRGFIDFPDTKNNGIYADISIKQDTVRVYNLHLQSFVIAPYIITRNYKNYNFWKKLNKTSEKQNEQARLVKSHADRSGKKVIISGDFNATPYSQTYRILKKDMDDSYISNGNGIGATYTRLNYPLRLDYFLNSIEIKNLSHQNFNLDFSDHEPIYINFKIK